MNGEEWEELLKGILGVNEKELEIFFTLNEYLRDEGHGSTEEGKIITIGVSIPTLFKGLQRTGSEPMLYRTLEKLRNKGYITRMGKGRYTLNVGAIQEKIERYKKIKLERELIMINKRVKELETLKKVKPIDYLSDAFGGLYIESEKYPEEPVSMDRLINCINSGSADNCSLLIQLHRKPDILAKNIANEYFRGKFREINRDKLDMRFIIPLPDSDAKDIFISFEDSLKGLFFRYYERANVRIGREDKMPSELVISCFISKSWVKLEKEGIKIEDIKQSFVSWIIPDSVEKGIYRGVINRDSRIVEYFTKAFLRFWETGKKVEEVIGK